MMKLKKSKPLSILVAALMLAAMLIISVATARPKQKPAAKPVRQLPKPSTSSNPKHSHPNLA